MDSISFTWLLRKVRHICEGGYAKLQTATPTRTGLPRSTLGASPPSVGALQSGGAEPGSPPEAQRGFETRNIAQRRMLTGGWASDQEMRAMKSNFHHLKGIGVYENHNHVHEPVRYFH